MGVRRYSDSIKQIEQQCESTERFLKDLVRGKHAHPGNYLPTDLCFAVSRRWNSWYPSYFDVEGGCYALIPGDIKRDDPENLLDKRNGVVIIDPGFKFVDILREEYQIEPHDVSTVIVTHFHPDHMGGLLEFATIMNTSRQSCTIYLNETTFATYKSIQNAFIAVNELRDGQIQEIMRYKTRDEQWVRVTVKAVGVHHTELGNHHRSLGLILNATLSPDLTQRTESSTNYQISIVGDTDGNEAYIPYYVNTFCDSDIMVLHLGTFSDKKLGRGGKHLYISGMANLLQQMKADASKKNGGKRIVVLSEFGLELANMATLYRMLQPTIESYSWRLPLLFVRTYLKQQADPNANTTSTTSACFFARSTLEFLDHIYEYKYPDSFRSPVITRSILEELLVAFTLQILAFSDNEFRATIKELTLDIAAFISEKKERRFLDRIPLEDYFHKLDQHALLEDNSLAQLQTFYVDMLGAAVFSHPIPQGERLEKACDILAQMAVRNFETPSNGIFFVQKLGYVGAYAQHCGIEGYQWAYDYQPGKGVKLDLFWVSCLVGIYLLRSNLSLAPSPPATEDEYPLIQIGRFFQQSAGDWANIIVGDIGCTFGLSPFKINQAGQRVQRIRLKGINQNTQKEDWISPYIAESVFEEETSRIIYRSES